MRHDGRYLVELDGLLIAQLEFSQGIKIERLGGENITSDVYTCWLGPQDLPKGMCHCILKGEECETCKAKHGR